METGEVRIARAKAVIIATGGAGRMHYQGFPTSNHYGATADGLILGYRAGAKLLYQDTLQYLSLIHISRTESWVISDARNSGKD